MRTIIEMVVLHPFISILVLFPLAALISLLIAAAVYAQVGFVKQEKQWRDYLKGRGDTDGR